jgi:2-oxo-4-hydroxy-4-carboxy-5-ureidoimidazoline decarboxylase
MKIPQTKEAFVARYGGVYEHSPWIAERAFESGPFDSIDELHEAMQRVVRDATRDEQLALIRAHPELLGKMERAKLTLVSRAEQAGAGLDRCTPEEKSKMRALNDAYRAKFRFPFVVAVKGMDWAEIIGHMEARLPNACETELDTALSEIGRIARFRLEALE